MTIVDSWGLRNWILFTAMVISPDFLMLLKPALGGYMCEVEALLFDVPAYIDSLSRPLGATCFDLQGYLKSTLHSILSYPVDLAAGRDILIWRRL